MPAASEQVAGRKFEGVGLMAKRHGHLEQLYEKLGRTAPEVSPSGEGGASQPPPGLVESEQSKAPPSEANIERTRQFFAKEFKLTGQGNSKQKEAYRLGVLFFARELDAAEKRGEERALQAAG